MRPGILRSVLFLVCTSVGALSGPAFASGPAGVALGAAAGVSLFAAVYGLEAAAALASPLGLAGAAGGTLAGLVGAVLLRQAAGLASLPAPLLLGVTVGCAYLGGAAGARGLRALRGGTLKAGMVPSSGPKVLDTSAVIDGRVADLVELGFVGGTVVVPLFVLAELQGIADSADALKRARGRRGLGILEKLQGMEEVEVRISEQDFPKIKEVDGKIVALAKATAATVVTNDFNLTKVAELQGVRVLNIHQLSHALRPVVLPGEEVQLTLQKQGKEQGQGIGYLEDGTMVVVEGGASRLGELVRTTVTSVLQTTAGRMIFAKPQGGEPAPDGPREKKSMWRRRS